MIVIWMLMVVEMAYTVDHSGLHYLSVLPFHFPLPLFGYSVLGIGVGAGVRGVVLLLAPPI